MKYVTVSCRMPAETKAAFEDFCTQAGLSMSAALNLFASKVARDYALPFEVRLDVPNRETLQAIEDVEHNIGLRGPFHSAREAFADIDRLNAREDSEA